MTRAAVLLHIAITAVSCSGDASRGSEHQAYEVLDFSERANVRMLTSDEPGKLRAYMRERFGAGVESGTISLRGQSRDATGASFFALSHPEKFASAVANSFVSDYALRELMRAAGSNGDRLRNGAIPIRMTIGAADRYLQRQNRTGSRDLHAYLQSLGIPHEYDTLPALTHDFGELWRFRDAGGVQAGLRDLQFHARAWGNGG